MFITVCSGWYALIIIIYLHLYITEIIRARVYRYR